MSKLTDYKPDTNNANKGTERGQYMVDASIQSYGAGRSIVVDKHGNVIAGNKTLQSAIDAGLVDAVEVVTSGDKLVVVKRDDLDLYADDKARLLAYADNRAGELGLQWDADAILADLSEGLDLGALFHESELLALSGEALEDIDFKEYGEDVADDVKMHVCPHCGESSPL